MIRNKSLEERVTAALYSRFDEARVSGSKMSFEKFRTIWELPIRKEINSNKKKKIDEEKFVYFLYNNNKNAVKIGSANDPQERVKGIQSANLDSLELIMTEKGGQKRELELHKMFEEYFIRNEWFSCVGRLKKYVKKKQ